MSEYVLLKKNCNIKKFSTKSMSLVSNEKKSNSKIKVIEMIRNIDNKVKSTL